MMFFTVGGSEVSGGAQPPQDIGLNLEGQRKEDLKIAQRL